MRIVRGLTPTGSPEEVYAPVRLLRRAVNFRERLLFSGGGFSGGLSRIGLGLGFVGGLGFRSECLFRLLLDGKHRLIFGLDGGELGRESLRGGSLFSATTIDQHEELLLLTPLLKPLPTSADFKTLGENYDASSRERHFAWETSASVMSGERVFRELGRSLARQRNGRLLHASYTANGLRPDHESLINRARAVIVVTANAGQNRYQHGFTKHVAMLCKSANTNSGEHKEKPCIVVAVSSPSDFATDSSIGTYICTFDFTETAQQALVKVLYGELTPSGGLPGTMRQSQKANQSRQHWLVENFNDERDSIPLDKLLQTVQGDQSQDTSALVGASSNTFLLRTSHIDEAHFVVRNSSTKELYGFCSTYYYKSIGTGVIGSIIVDPGRRKLSIGHSLHSRAIRSLLQKKGVKEFQLGSRLPSIYLGIPSNSPSHRKRLRQWFANMGWNVSISRPVCSMILRDVPNWRPPDGLGHTLSNPDVKYDLVAGSEYIDVMINYIKPNARQGVLEVYQLALADKANCGIIRAKRAEDGTILGSVIIYKAGSKLGGFVPAVADQRIAAGGISSLIISGSAADSKSLIQGLVLLGVRQVKKQGSSVVIMDNVRLLLAPTPGYTDNFRWTLTGRRIVYQELASACCTASKR